MATDNNSRMASLPVRPELMMALVLVCLTLAVYVQVKDFDFCNYDDHQYVYQNPWVSSGFSARGIAWAFTAFHAGNWHPLTWLSHMADSQLYGMSAGNHHLTSVILHVLNTLLLFAAFCRMTGMRWQSFFLAAVFALHPLHVESVAWVAERKDVLSTFFMLLALTAYIRYAAAPSRTRYLPVLGFFICGLLSKPMVVTFPAILLLLDYWPLRRLNSAATGKKNVQALLLEKAPLFLCAAFSTGVAFTAQVKGGAVTSLADIPLQHRIANAISAYCLYLRDMLAPSGLGVMYPLTQDIAFVPILGAGVIMLVITLGVLRKRTTQPWLAVGWLWYIVTLLPVIGIIRIGVQSRADRYTYIPLIGIGVGVIWGISFLLKRSAKATALGVFGGLLLLSALAVLSYRQVHYWRNSIALFEHTLSVTSNNFVAHNNLAAALIQENRFAEAIAHCRLSLAINPNSGEPYVNIGQAFAQQGDLPQAVQNYRLALELNPGNPFAHNNLGNAFALQHDPDRALEHYRHAVQLMPLNPDFYCNIGKIYAAQGMLAEAVSNFRKALDLNPASENASSQLEKVLQLQRGASMP